VLCLESFINGSAHDETCAVLKSFKSAEVAQDWAQNPSSEQFVNLHYYGRCEPIDCVDGAREIS
jgi:hypothetical protein